MEYMPTQRAPRAPVRDAFQESGMTEDEAVELFEAEKHAMRTERRDAVVA